MDPYAVLGVAPVASEAEIRAAYLRRSKQLHPDVGGTDEQMRELNAAYAAALAARTAGTAVPGAGPAPNWSQNRPETGQFRDQFAHGQAGGAPTEPGPRPPVRLRPKQTTRKRFYKRPLLWAMGAVTVAFILTSGATNPPSSDTRPAVYALIGRCVNLANRDIDDVVPCAGPHDAWVIAVVDRQEPCPPLATGYVATISHHICVTTER